MNLLWVSDLSTRHTLGGAERSDDILIQKGASMGVNITHFTLDSAKFLLLDEYDHVVSSNITSMCHIHPSIISFLQGAKKHSRIEHDMGIYFPNEYRRAIYGNCQRAFFLSQYHLDLFKVSYGDIFPTASIVADPIDTSIFFNKGRERRNSVLYAGFLHEGKGTDDFFDYVSKNPSIDFTLVGWGSEQYEQKARSFRNLNFLGRKSYEEMPCIFNEYSTMAYFPKNPEPFCRSVAEAKLCGMEIISNQKVGCLHEIERLGEEAFKESCGNAAQIFWQTILSA